jgi:hypothetical protein
LFDIFKIVFSNIDKHLSTMQEKIAQQNFDGWKRNNYPDLLQLFKDLAEISSNESEQKNRYSKIKEILIWVKTHKEFSCVRFGDHVYLSSQFDSRLKMVMRRPILVSNQTKLGGKTSHDRLKCYQRAGEKATVVYH